MIQQAKTLMEAAIESTGDWDKTIQNLELFFRYYFIIHQRGVKG